MAATVSPTVGDAGVDTADAAAVLALAKAAVRELCGNATTARRLAEFSFAADAMTSAVVATGAGRPGVVQLRFPINVVPNGGAENIKGWLHGGSAAWALTTLPVTHLVAHVAHATGHAASGGGAGHAPAVRGGTNLAMSFIEPLPVGRPAVVTTVVRRAGGRLAFVDSAIVDAGNETRCYVTASLTVALDPATTTAGKGKGTRAAQFSRL